MASSPLRIGYVPAEHFSTPLHFATAHFSLNATLIPYPSGTGHMVSSLQSRDIDVAIGLTEGFVAARVNQGDAAGFQLVGTFVETPLCWAISTGAGMEMPGGAQGLEGKKIGVSRVGSGSYVMGFVLADSFGGIKSPGQPPFTVVPLHTFQKLREAVNDGTADFFMWEHFTSKRYFDSGEIVRIGEIYTPWSSWKIAAVDAEDDRLRDLFEKLNQGVEYFLSHPEEAVGYISTELDYSEEDARDWLKTVRFSQNVRGVRRDVVTKTIEILEKAGVVEKEKDAGVEKVIGILRED